MKKNNYFTENPGLDILSAKYLVSKKINLVGIDSPSIDLGKDESFSVHHILSKNNILIVENLANMNKITIFGIYFYNSSIKAKRCNRFSCTCSSIIIIFYYFVILKIQNNSKFNMSKPGNIWRKVHGKITKKPTNFSWLIEEKLAGSGIPTSLDEFDWLLNQGVKSIVTMTEHSLPDEWVAKHWISSCPNS